MIDDHVYLHQPERITIAPTARIDWNVRINGGDGCVIGEHVHIATGCVINAGNGFVEMQEGSGCSNNVVIAGGHPDMGYLHISAADLPENQHPVHKRTIIGRHVIIFPNATIYPGVTIGDCSVIGAGSVVTHDVPSFEVWGGIPARKLRDRPLTELIGREEFLHVVHGQRRVDEVGEVDNMQNQGLMVA